MSQITTHRRVYGFVILALLFIAGLGPWSFDLINVPAQYPCDAPFIRLKGDFCGEPVSAVRGVSALLGGSIVALITGDVAFIDWGQLFMMILYLFIVLLPLVSAARWVSGSPQQRQSIFHLAAWGLATIFVWFGYSIRLLSTPLQFQLQFQPGQLWGLWLYTGTVSIVLILEVAAFAFWGRSNRA